MSINMPAPFALNEKSIVASQLSRVRACYARAVLGIRTGQEREANDRYGLADSGGRRVVLYGRFPNDQYRKFLFMPQ